MKKRKLMTVAALFLAISFMMAARGPYIPAGSVLVMDLGGSVEETSPWNPFMSLFSMEDPTVLDKVRVLSEAGKDKKIKAAVVRIRTAQYSFGKAQEFRQAIMKFKESGKPIHAYLELEGGGNKEYYLASACDKVYISPASNLGLTGLSVFRYYLGGVWEKIYVDMQVQKIKEYKSMGDMLSKKSMSDAERQMQNAILDSLYEQFLTDIAKSRSVTKEDVENWVNEAWFVNDKYVEAGAIDGKRYLVEVMENLGGNEKNIVSEREFIAVIDQKYKKSRAPKVAVVYGVGNIIHGQSSAGPFGPGNIIASDQMIRQLEKVYEDDSINAVIFRVDSGGGSALASDLIWRAVERLQEKKPIVISMSDVAASGGYYIACGADKIVAQPGTITGSIGIVAVYPSMGKLLDKIGVGTDGLGRGKYSQMGRMDRKLSSDELQKTHKELSSMYDLFIGRVANGRGITKEEVNEIGRGRVWTGEMAKERGLVDRLGGFDVAISEIKKLLKVSEDSDVNLVYRREKVTLWKLFTGKIEASVMDGLLTKDEQEIVHSLRFSGHFRPCQPLAILPGPVEVR
jgi:protease IV